MKRKLQSQPQQQLQPNSSSITGHHPSGIKDMDFARKCSKQSPEMRNQTAKIATQPHCELQQQQRIHSETGQKTIQSNMVGSTPNNSNNPQNSGFKVRKSQIQSRNFNVNGNTTGGSSRMAKRMSIGSEATYQLMAQGAAGVGNGSAEDYNQNRQGGQKKVSGRVVPQQNKPVAAASTLNHKISSTLDQDKTVDSFTVGVGGKVGLLRGVVESQFNMTQGPPSTSIGFPPDLQMHPSQKHHQKQPFSSERNSMNTIEGSANANTNRRIREGSMQLRGVSKPQFSAKNAIEPIVGPKAPPQMQNMESDFQGGKVLPASKTLREVPPVMLAEGGISSNKKNGRSMLLDSQGATTTLNNHTQRQVLITSPQNNSIKNHYGGGKTTSFSGSKTTNYQPPQQTNQNTSKATAAQIKIAAMAANQPFERRSIDQNNPNKVLGSGSRDQYGSSKQQSSALLATSNLYNKNLVTQSSRTANRRNQYNLAAAIVSEEVPYPPNTSHGGKQQKSKNTTSNNNNFLVNQSTGAMDGENNTSLSRNNTIQVRSRINQQLVGADPSQHKTIQLDVASSKGGPAQAPILPPCTAASAVDQKHKKTADNTASAAQQQNPQSKSSATRMRQKHQGMVTKSKMQHQYHHYNSSIDDRDNNSNEILLPGTNSQAQTISHQITKKQTNPSTTLTGSHILPKENLLSKSSRQPLKSGNRNNIGHGNAANNSSALGNHPANNAGGNRFASERRSLDHRLLAAATGPDSIPGGRMSNNVASRIALISKSKLLQQQQQQEGGNGRLASLDNSSQQQNQKKQIAMINAYAKNSSGLRTTTNFRQQQHHSIHPTAMDKDAIVKNKQLSGNQTHQQEHQNDASLASPMPKSSKSKLIKSGNLGKSHNTANNTLMEEQLQQMKQSSAVTSKPQPQTNNNSSATKLNKKSAQSNPFAASNTEVKGQAQVQQQAQVFPQVQVADGQQQLASSGLKVRTVQSRISKNKMNNISASGPDDLANTPGQAVESKSITASEGEVPPVLSSEGTVQDGVELQSNDQTQENTSQSQPLTKTVTKQQSQFDKILPPSTGGSDDKPKKQVINNNSQQQQSPSTEAAALASTTSQQQQAMEMFNVRFTEPAPTDNPLKDFEPAKYASKTHGLITSYSANTHQGIQRNYNEDRVSIILNMTRPSTRKDVTNWPKCSYFAIYDGHGGSACADFLKDQLHLIIINQESFPKDPAQALTTGCLEAERRFIESADRTTQMHERSGSCGIVVLIVGKECYVANVGDSRAIMSADKGKKLFLLSRDHRPNEDYEVQRIVKNGGGIYQTQSIQNVQIPGEERMQQQFILGPHRVIPGRLSVSRTFGDIEAKHPKYGGKEGVIIAQPEISQFTVRNDFHDFIVLGCDGIFDRLSNQQVLDACWDSINSIKSNEVKQGSIVQKTVHQVSGAMADSIIKQAAIERSMDNLTIVIVSFQNLEQFLSDRPKPTRLENHLFQIKEVESGGTSTIIQPSPSITASIHGVHQILNNTNSGGVSSPFGNGSSRASNTSKRTNEIREQPTIAEVTTEDLPEQQSNSFADKITTQVPPLTKQSPSDATNAAVQQRSITPQATNSNTNNAPTAQGGQKKKLFVSRTANQSSASNRGKQQQQQHPEDGSCTNNGQPLSTGMVSSAKRNRAKQSQQQALIKQSQVTRNKPLTVEFAAQNSEQPIDLLHQSNTTRKSKIATAGGADVLPKLPQAHSWVPESSTHTKLLIDNKKNPSAASSRGVLKMASGKVSSPEKKSNTALMHSEKNQKPL